VFLIARGTSRVRELCESGCTPKGRRIINDTIPLQTPKHSHDIPYAVQNLGSRTREQQTVFQKAQKALCQVTAQYGLLHATNQRRQLQLNELKSKKKKRKIILDPNYMFANVASIKKSLKEAEKAQREAEMAKARIAEKRALVKAKEPSAEATALSTSQTLQKARMESCMFPWEL